jgi:hypothetical protein
MEIGNNMRCIFCKNSSKDSKSREHILPESIGNTECFLPPGWVCDKCNNYFSRKVEAPFLNSEYGKRSRFEMRVPSKRGKIPAVTGFHPQSKSEIEFYFHQNEICVGSTSDENIDFIKSIQSKNNGTLFIPMAGDPVNSYELSRFIGKVALEALTYRLHEIPNSNDEIVNKVELDELRNYVRYGKKGFIWPIHSRRLHSQEQAFADKNTPLFQVLNEWDILFIPDKKESNTGEYYAIIAIFGFEYGINLGGPELDGYLKWLKEHEFQSYLYIDKNKDGEFPIPNPKNN